MIWVFLGGLALVEVAFAILAARTDRPVIPVDVDDTWQTAGVFYRDRPDRTREVDLGNRWTSATDPGAMFSLSWIKETGELVALRRAEHVPMFYGGGIVAALPLRRLGNKSGMKVLARVDLRELHRLHPHQIERERGGLDRLTGALGCPYFAPEGADAPVGRVASA
jgi:hypothetical protein